MGKSGRFLTVYAERGLSKNSRGESPHWTKVPSVKRLLLYDVMKPLLPALQLLIGGQIPFSEKAALSIARHSAGS